MRELVNPKITKICVGYTVEGVVSGQYNYFLMIYDAKKNKCIKMLEADIKELISKGEKIRNLYMTERGALKCTYIKKDKLSYNSLTAVGIVSKSRKYKDIIGFDVVRNTGDIEYINLKEACKNAWCDVIRNMKCPTSTSINYNYKEDGTPLYVRYADESEEYVSETLSDVGKQAVADGDIKPETDEDRVKKLKSLLVFALTELDKIRPVQFHDIDCDDCVYNFSDVKIDEKDNRIYVEIAMWHDNLPSHVKNPLKDGRGRDILPEKKED